MGVLKSPSPSFHSRNGPFLSVLRTLKLIWIGFVSLSTTPFSFLSISASTEVIGLLSLFRENQVTSNHQPPSIISFRNWIEPPSTLYPSERAEVAGCRWTVSVSLSLSAFMRKDFDPVQTERDSSGETLLLPSNHCSATIQVALMIPHFMTLGSKN